MKQTNQDTEWKKVIQIIMKKRDLIRTRDFRMLLKEIENNCDKLTVIISISWKKKGECLRLKIRKVSKVNFIGILTAVF